MKKLLDEYRSLSMFNKLGLLASIATIAALLLSLVPQKALSQRPAPKVSNSQSADRSSVTSSTVASEITANGANSSVVGSSNAGNNNGVGNISGVSGGTIIVNTGSNPQITTSEPQQKESARTPQPTPSPRGSDATGRPDVGSQTQNGGNKNNQIGSVGRDVVINQGDGASAMATEKLKRLTEISSYMTKFEYTFGIDAMDEVNKGTKEGQQQLVGLVGQVMDGFETQSQMYLSSRHFYSKGARSQLDEAKELASTSYSTMRNNLSGRKGQPLGEENGALLKKMLVQMADFASKFKEATADELDAMLSRQ